MNDWTKSASSLELLETLRKDLEMLYEVASRDDADNIDASLHVVDALKERLESLPIPQEQSITLGDTDEYRKGYADGIREITDYFNNFGQ